MLYTFYYYTKLNSLGGLKLVGDQIENTDNLFSGFQDIRVATFGDSEFLKPGDWLPIMLSNLPSDAFSNDVKSDGKSSPGVCENMILSLHIKIAFAKVGSFANPQSKIMGVSYQFGNSQDVTYQCIGFGACKNPSKTQRIEISSSVKFTDVTLPALDFYAEYPVIEARLPHDFFYPFLTSSKSSGTKEGKNKKQTFQLTIWCMLHWLFFCSS